MEQTKYFSLAWNDIKNSPGWKGKIALLALLQIIPIFGQIVLFGYIYGWARDIAWGVHSPMPAKIFGNEDGKLYSRGFFILVILFVFSFVPNFLLNIPGAAMSVNTLSGDGYPGTTFAFTSTMLSLVQMLVSLVVLIAFSISAMRTAIYDRISAGFQLNKVWAMFKYDSNGALRIFGMTILVGFIGSLIIGIVSAILFSFAGLAFVPAIMSISVDPTPAEVFAIAGPGIMLFGLLAVVIGFIVALFASFLHTLVARASGYWTQQFQVAQWRGQDDPMPFEAEAAARAAQQAQYAAQAEYAQAQAQYAQAQGQQINYAHQQAQAEYARAQQQSAQGMPVQQSAPQGAEPAPQTGEPTQTTLSDQLVQQPAPNADSANISGQSD